MNLLIKYSGPGGETVDERSLLLLGLLLVQSQHGYQLNEFIERNLSRVTDMKKSTAYATLDRLCDAGFVDKHMEQEGNRPPRKVYAMTSAGKQHFYDMLRENLSHADQMNFASDIGMMFLDHLSRKEVLKLLESRLHQLQTQVDAYASAPKHRYGLGVDFAIEHHLVHLRADVTWLHSIIHRIKEDESDDGIE